MIFFGVWEINKFRYGESLGFSLSCFSVKLGALLEFCFCVINFFFFGFNSLLLCVTVSCLCLDLFLSIVLVVDYFSGFT